MATQVIPLDPLPLRELVAAAILAPSSHNTQPWRFRLAAHRIDLWADRTRALPVNDPDDRELLLSCGAALFNLRVASARHGLAASVVLQPDAAHPDLLARVALAPTPHEGPLAAGRRWSRRPAPRARDSTCSTTRRAGTPRPCWWPKATRCSGAIPSGDANWPRGCTRPRPATGSWCRGWPRRWHA